MAGVAAKAFTGLTGLKVAVNPTHTLGVLYSKTLRALAKMPAEYPYRKQTETLVVQRADIIKNTPTIMEAEQKIGMGQIEEVIIQAENELVLARNILEWRAWEPLAEKAPKDQWKWPL
ncbi:NADH dehydrogenase [ubiquinone] 1 alpha subcomplex subunit 5 [Eurytemora carolleeae]|uniref:NADH dehydrogenase [ubiquinone] 1 alpha subcomplex subunit 5 n=1 Tax=Eurytemora carolleeae TaxID=1294199 RepID=UPI000C787534|nr:NADH dehydrogenase [ubiquinone] 1 alpha subcomplex subunit 5 [Eurytemora carolleeae]|eukprot:XP_023341363.1 NADH dehydrogenase [ubiquinone] 1 alpha subcomplex subunit 5-like [Eurytemora affinis]